MMDKIQTYFQPLLNEEYFLSLCVFFFSFGVFFK